MAAAKKPWTDSTGRTLADYPRPSIAVDTCVLTVPADRPELHVVLVRQHRGPRGTRWSLPGTFLHPGETLDDAVLRSLRDKAGIDGPRPQQLRVLDDPARDHRGWVITVAHVVAVPWHSLADGIGTHRDVQLTPVSEMPALPWDHERIVALAAEHLRHEYAAAPDPAELVPRPFTMRQLKRVHEAVAGRPLPKDAFRRRMTPQLRDTGRKTEGAPGRPASLLVSDAARRGR